MLIKQFKVKNFKSLRSFELDDPAKVNVIVGKNGAGKSSVLESLRFLLTGELPSIPITAGENLCTVSADYLGISVERSFGKKATIKLNGKSTTQKSAMQIITDELGCTADTLKLATSADMLSAMSAGDFSNYLISNNLIPAEIDFDTLSSLCTVSPAAKEELLMMLPAAPMKFDMDAIDEAYEHFFAARTLYKGRLKEKEAEAKFEGIVPTRTLNAVDKELQWFFNYDSESEAYKKLKKAYDDAIEQRKLLQTKIKDIEKHISEKGDVKPVDPKELIFLKSQKERFDENISEVRRIIQTLEMNISLFERTLVNLDKPICPISEKLICTTDKTPIKNELLSLKEKNTVERDEANKKLAGLTERLKSIEERITDYNNREEEYNSVKLLYDNRKVLLDALPTIPELPKAPIEPDDPAKKTALEEERQNILRHEASTAAKKEAAALSRKLEVLEEIVKLLSPKNGIRQEIIRVALAPIVAHCNSRASALKMGFEVGLQADNGIKIVYKPNATTVTKPLPIENASAGEQAYILFLIMDALNALHGLGLLLLDDLDKLDSEALDALLSLFSNADVLAPYDHVFLAMVDHGDALTTIHKHKGTLIDKVIEL